jgi:FkbM family methyltransferase
MIKDLIEKLLEKKPEIRSEILNKFISNNILYKRFSFGKNDETISVNSIFKLEGVIDDNAAEASQWNNFKLFNLSSLPENSIIVNCSTSIYPISVENRLISLNIPFISFHELLKYNSNHLKLPSFISEMKNDLNENYSNWNNLYNKLSDDLSKDTLKSIVCFRLTADYFYMKNFKVSFNDQYFDNIIKKINIQSFADIGGFDGDTTLLFSIYFPNYRKIYFFEPSTINLQKARKNLKNLENIEFFNIGLSDKSGKECFLDNYGSASCINDNGEIEIQLNTFDNLIEERVDFIKMDIEGYELSALKGCQKQISEYTPILALAIYHNAYDFWKIPELVLTYNSDYKLFIRHYTEGWSETVMYFIPQKYIL